MDITINMLTPLWTGGKQAGSMDRVHETGILGSLRWWYEAIMRGLGAVVPDPTQAERSGFDQERYAHSTASEDAARLHDAGLCDVSQLFGATGWRRRFRLRVIDRSTPAWTNLPSLNIKPYGRTRGWFLPAGRVGELTLSLLGDDASLRQISGLLQFLEKWGNLGARPQLGYGVFRIVDARNMPAPQIWLPQERMQQPSAFPDMRSWTWFKLRFRPAGADWWHEVPGLRELRSQANKWSILRQLATAGMVPVMPALKNHLRFEHQWSADWIPHWLFGTLRGDERLRSKISLSWAYRLHNSDEWEIRGWVYLPQDTKGCQARSEIVRVLHASLERPQQWLQILTGQSSAFRSSQVIFAPTPEPWHYHTSQQVADFLNGTAG